MTAIRNRWWVALIASAFAVLAGSSVACSYPPREHADADVMNTPIIFRGRVVAIQSSVSARLRRQQVTFQLLERWKGSLGSSVTAVKVSDSITSCGGEPIPENFEGIVFASVDAEGVIGIGQFFRGGAGAPTETLARLREERDAADALVGARPGEIGPLLSRARLLRRWRDHQNALHAYRGLADVAPQLTEPVAGMAQMLIAQNKAREALAVLVEAEARLGPHLDFSAARSVARLVLGERENLRQLDLRGADLSGIDLSRRDLRGVDFSGALLRSVDLQHSDLRAARFIGTRFDQVRMQRANLEGATFTAPIGFPNVEGANLSRARLDRIVLHGHLSLVNVNLEGANIVESRLRGVILQRTRMRGANFSTVFLQGGMVVEPDFAGATLRDVTFLDFTSETSVGYRRLEAQDLRGARLVNVRFE